nr:PQQ-binding-like beta-propeller repeat protein [uncultured Fretibacterium sp.]
MMRRVLSVMLLSLLACAAPFFGDAAWAWSGRLAWTFRAEAPLTSSVAVAGGLVLAGDSVGNLYAVHSASGQAAWIYNGTNSIVGRPTVAGNKVIFAQADGTITCLSLKNGDVAWQYVPPEESYAAETVVDGAAVGDGKVFFVKGDGKLYAISAVNGRALWTYNSELELRSAPAFASGLVLLGEQRGVFSAISPANGKRLWGGGAGGAINTPATDGANVYFSSWDGSVQSVRIKGVVPQWKSDVGDPITTPPFIGGGKVFVGTANGKVAALDSRSGSVLWTFDTQGGNMAAQPVFAEGLVFAGGGQGTLFVLDAASGTERFTFSAGAGINSSPAFSGGVLYLASADGNLYAIR